MILVRNETASPDIRSFQATVREILNQYIRDVNRERDQNNKLAFQEDGQTETRDDELEMTKKKVFGIFYDRKFSKYSMDQWKRFRGSNRI